jgi:hypothetical protein
MNAFCDLEIILIYYEVRVPERIGVQRKLEDLTGWVFGGILEMVRVLFPTLFPTGLGLVPRIHFWHDVWWGEGALKYSFSEFYSIAHNKEALGDKLFGPLQFPNPLESKLHYGNHDWELESLDSFLNLLYSSNTNPGRSG